MQSSIHQCLSIVAATEAMKPNQCSFELELSHGIVPSKPMSSYSKVQTMITVGPNISSEADLTCSFLKIGSAA
jgi:hypothetical protein